MPKMIPFTNHGKHAAHIGSKTIMPGDTREVAETDHPDYKPPAQIVDIELTYIDHYPAMNAKDIIASLPNLSDEELIEVTELETAGKNRKSVVEAMANEQLLRTKADDVQSTMDAYKLQFSQMDDEELESQFDVFKDQVDILELVTEEKANRG